MAMTEASTKYSGSVAGEWDVLRSGYFSESVRDTAIRKAYLRREMTVADVGAGTGFMAAGLAPLVRQVYVLEGSPAMLEEARGNLSHLDNLTYYEADGQALPLDDASVDAAFANMYLHHCPDPAGAIREMVRVLRPGGRLVLTDLDVHSHEWMRDEMAHEWMGFDRDQVKAWLREAGLVNVLVDCTGDSCCAEAQADSDDGGAEISVFVATGTRRVSGAREAVQANYGARAESAGCGCASQEASSCCEPPPAATEPCCGSSASAEEPCCGAEPMASESCCESQVAAEPCCGSEPTTSDSCCGPSSKSSSRVDFRTGYTEDQLEAVPQEAAELSLGCGNPTAIASLRPGEVVLDIGSGGGIDCFYAARRVGPEGRVIGLDMTPAMIERATRSARAAGLDQVEFRLGHAEAMPVDDGVVDVILSNCVINLTEDKGRVFEEAYRVLKEGGRVSISDMVSDGPFPMSMLSDPGNWAGCIWGALPEREYLDLIAHAGFTDIRAERSASGGEIQGVRVYSLAVSARKGDGEGAETSSASSGSDDTGASDCCKEGCCG
jgi:ubiquinone/menaquinone biosynthesis C-methylase UbiE